MRKPLIAAAISTAVLFTYLSAGHSQTAPGAASQQAAAGAPAIQVAVNQALPAGARSTAASEGETGKVEQLNKWTINILGGQTEGSFHRFAAQLAKALDDRKTLRVLPIVSYGAVGNVEDLLYLKGMDIAITNADVLYEFKKKRNISNIEKRINYISQLYVSEVHVFAGPEIKTLQDLDGKVVSLGAKGAGQNITARIVLGRLGIHPKFINGNSADHIQKLQNGEVAAVFHNGGKPNGLFARLKPQPGFHFVPIPFDNRIADYYVPSSFTSKDYPDLVREGETIDTLGIPTLLAVYNWPAGTDRYRKVRRFIEYYFKYFDKLKKPPFDPKWKDINLAAKVPGWERYSVSSEMLAKYSPATAKKRQTEGDGGTYTSSGQRLTPEQERLFREFLESRKRQQQR